MIVATIVLTALVQGPNVDAWTARGHDRHPDAVVVKGRVGLTPGEAFDTARDAAVERLEAELRKRGTRLVEDRRPFWLPGFVGDQVLDKWVRRIDAENLLEIVDRHEEPTETVVGYAYETRLMVRADDDGVEKAVRRLRGMLRESSEWFLVKCGGTILLWGVLALGCAWIDRLTRGYMTWRLRFLFSSVGIALPSIAFLAI